MKKIVFEKIFIKNFLSIGEQAVCLEFKNGTNLITGTNCDNSGRNGVGKSSIIESIYWVLFGSTTREIKKDKIIHNQSKKDCEVTLTFSLKEGETTNNYKIIRSLEPNKVSMFRDDEDVTLSTMPKTDERIKELIGANEEVFQNAVIMTANNTMPFMAQKKIDKRKFVEGILNLGIFGEMLLKVRSHYNEYKKENDILASSFNTQNKNLNLYQEQIEKNKKIKEDKITNLLEKIQSNTEKINIFSNNSSIEEEIKAKREEIENKKDFFIKLEDGLEKTETKLQEKLKEQLTNDFKVKNSKDEIKSIEEKTGICPTCKRKYDFDDSCVDLDQLKENLKTNLTLQSDTNGEISVIAEKKVKIKTAIRETKNFIDLTDKDIQKLLLTSQEIGNLQTRNDEILSEIEQIKNTKDSVFDFIEKIEKEIVETEEKLQKLQKQLLILENAKFVVSEEGVKTFIVKKMLSVLNAQLNYYLKTLGAPCTCYFNEMFEETIYNSNSKECSYFNFSGGERKRIDIAILFMFQDILRMQTGISFNISMYDELFDSALDENGVLKVFDVLKERSEKFEEAIYVISHNKAAINTNFSNIIELQKKNGKTTIVS